MKRPVASFVALAACLFLALPPGACGLILRHAQGKTAPVKASCCHKATSSNHPCHPDKSPARPTLRCCCTHDDALPVRAAQLPEAGPALYTLAPCDLGPYLQQVHCFEASPVLSFSDSRLHLF